MTNTIDKYVGQVVYGLYFMIIGIAWVTTSDSIALNIIGVLAGAAGILLLRNGIFSLIVRLTNSNSKETK